MTTSQPTGQQQVRVTRTEIATPDLTDPHKITLQIQYQVGELPPRFLYIAKKDWTKEKEAALIKADLAKRLSTPGEIITI
jgi:hypothetical protein